jgi:hypothetical protein
MGLNFYEFAPGEWRVRDVELGQWLGYSRPVQIRELIERLSKTGFFADSGVIRTARKTSEAGGRPGNEFWLDEESAYLVTARSETAKGKDFMRRLVRMFLSLKSAAVDVEQLKALCFTRELSNHEQQLFIPLLGLLAQARGEDPGTRSYPWGPWVGQLVYACAEGHVGELQKYRREINPECRHRDYNHMTEGQKKYFGQVLAVATAFADICVRTGESLGRWREMMLAHFGKQPLQLTLADNARRLLAPKPANRTRKRSA